MLHNEPQGQPTGRTGTDTRRQSSPQTRTDLSQNRIRLYIPFGEPAYSYFYMMRLEDEVTADEVLQYALSHMRVHYSVVKQRLDYTYFDETSSLSSNFDESCLPMVDPNQFTLALKISPSSHKSNQKKLNEDL